MGELVAARAENWAGVSNLVGGGLPSGTELGGYVIEAAIGQGGHGVVYRASHRHLGTVVALKEYLPATVAVRTEGLVCPRNPSVVADYEEGLRRFMDEARHLAQFRSHPGVVTCLGFFEARGTAYMAMEYEEGLPLSELLTKREAAGNPLDERELLRLAEQVLESLAVVHEAAVLHRDIKPSNILIRRSDDQPVLIDFGAAKDDFVRYTKSSAPHTQGYAAIEQMEADGKLGPWTDLYGLGAVLWRIVAGGHPSYERLVPVDALSRMAARFRGQQDPLLSARKLGAGRFSIAVLEAIDKCLELEPSDRPADCGKLLVLLHAPDREGVVDSRYTDEGKEKDKREERGSGRDVEPPSGKAEQVDLLQAAPCGEDVLQQATGPHSHRTLERAWASAGRSASSGPKEMHPLMGCLSYFLVVIAVGVVIGLLEVLLRWVGLDFLANIVAALRHVIFERS